MNLESLDNFLAPVVLRPGVALKYFDRSESREIIVDGVMMGRVCYYAMNPENNNDMLIKWIEQMGDGSADIEYNTPRLNLFRILVKNRYLEGLIALMKTGVFRAWKIQIKTGELKTPNELISLMDFEHLIPFPILFEGYYFMELCSYLWDRGEKERALSVIETAIEYQPSKPRIMNSYLEMDLFMSDRFSEELWNLILSKFDVQIDDNSEALTRWFSSIPSISEFEKKRPRLRRFLNEKSLAILCISTCKFKRELYYPIRDEMKSLDCWKISVWYFRFDHVQRLAMDLDTKAIMEIINSMEDVTGPELKSLVNSAINSGKINHLESLILHPMAKYIFTCNQLIEVHSETEDLDPKILEIIVRESNKYSTSKQGISTMISNGRIYGKRTYQGMNGNLLICLEILVRSGFCTKIPKDHHPLVIEHIESLVECRSDPGIQKYALFMMALSGFIKVGVELNPALERFLKIIKKLPSEITHSLVTGDKRISLLTRKIAIRELFLYFSL